MALPFLPGAPLGPPATPPVGFPGFLPSAPPLPGQPPVMGWAQLLQNDPWKYFQRFMGMGNTLPPGATRGVPFGGGGANTPALPPHWSSVGDVGADTPMTPPHWTAVGRDPFFGGANTPAMSARRQFFYDLAERMSGAGKAVQSAVPTFSRWAGRGLNVAGKVAPWLAAADAGLNVYNSPDAGTAGLRGLTETAGGALGGWFGGPPGAAAGAGLAGALANQLFPEYRSDPQWGPQALADLADPIHNRRMYFPRLAEAAKAAAAGAGPASPPPVNSTPPPPQQDNLSAVQKALHQALLAANTEMRSRGGSSWSPQLRDNLYAAEKQYFGSNGLDKGRLDKDSLMAALAGLSGLGSTGGTGVPVGWGGARGDLGRLGGSEDLYAGGPGFHQRADGTWTNVDSAGFHNVCTGF